MEWPFRFHKELDATKPPYPLILRRAGFALALLAAVLVLFNLLRPFLGGGNSRDVPVPVFEATSQAKNVPVQIHTIGHVQPINSVAVRARVEGQVTAVAIGEGQSVKAGDLLFQLDDRQARAALDQAVANLARDQAQLEFARKEVERRSKLAKSDFVSRSQLDQARSNADALAATVAAGHAQVANAQAALSYTTVTAPIDGRAGSISVKMGNTVEPGSDTPLVTINQIAPIYVSFSISQSEIAALRGAFAAGPVEVTAQPAGDGTTTSTGMISFYDNAIDSGTGTLGVWATFSNPGEQLWPGQFVTVTVTLRVEPNAVTVPAIAVQMGQSGSYLFVIKPDQTVEMRLVTVSRTVHDEAVIAKGLKPGERVVTSGQLRLVPGSKIRPAAAAPGKTNGNGPAS